MFSSSDLSSVLVAPDQEFAGFAQGVLASWDPETFENTVRVRGSDLHDLPVASGVEALTYSPGDVLMLTRWRPSGGGVASYWVGMGGRVVYPGSGRAEETIAWLRGQLARSISAEIFADRVHSLDTSNSFTTSSTDFVSAPDGPLIEGVNVSPAGTMIVGVGALVDANSSVGQIEGHMSPALTGPTPRSATRSDALTIFLSDLDDGVLLNQRSMAWSVKTNLQPGTYSVEVQYSIGLNSEPDQPIWSDRTLIIIAL